MKILFVSQVNVSELGQCNYVLVLVILVPHPVWNLFCLPALCQRQWSQRASSGSYWCCWIEFYNWDWMENFSFDRIRKRKPKEKSMKQTVTIDGWKYWILCCGKSLKIWKILFNKYRKKILNRKHWSMMKFSILNKTQLEDIVESF